MKRGSSCVWFGPFLFWVFINIDEIHIFLKRKVREEAQGVFFGCANVGFL